MKLSNFGSLLAMSLAVAATTAWGAQVTSRSNDRELLQDLRNLTLKCVVRPYTIDAQGAKIALPLRSICSELVVTAPETATIQIENQVFTAELTESEDSDGGDLDHLTIRNDEGQIVAQRRNVAAFDDILIALAAGSENFPDVLEN
ncbi:MAG: hypothetical protein P4M08_09645 [Oligoflexia bacterium]|nr:hypothetical protein [Oligoflexia bacterium]